jgi:hypothetical protein
LTDKRWRRSQSGGLVGVNFATSFLRGRRPQAPIDLVVDIAYMLDSRRGIGQPPISTAPDAVGRRPPLTCRSVEAGGSVNR